jgi:hypothetical protein
VAVLFAAGIAVVSLGRRLQLEIAVPGRRRTALTKGVQFGRGHRLEAAGNRQVLPENPATGPWMRVSRAGRGNRAGFHTVELTGPVREFAPRFIVT